MHKHFLSGPTFIVAVVVHQLKVVVLPARAIPPASPNQLSFRPTTIDSSVLITLEYSQVAKAAARTRSSYSPSRHTSYASWVVEC
jgi:hypothetical protein